MNLQPVLGLAVAKSEAERVTCRPVTVHEAFQATLQALITHTGRSQADLSKQTKISESTFSKWKKPNNGARFDYLERLRNTFGLKPAELFDPAMAISAVSAIRREAHGESAHFTLESHSARPVDSQAPPPSQKGAGPAVADTPLFRQLVGFWSALEPRPDLQKSLVQTAAHLAVDAVGDPSPTRPRVAKNK